VDTSVAELLRELDTQPPFALLDVLEAHLATLLGATEVSLWLIDYDLRTLRCWSPPGTPGGDELPVDGDGDHGSCFVGQRTLTAGQAHAHRVLSPVTVRAERLGVLEVILPDAPDASVVQRLEGTASIVAYVLLSARRYTDVFERVRRHRELEVPAELQWELLPVLAHDGPDFVLAGALEPAYDIGGDNFDYSVDPRGLHVSITDAMGHGTRAAMLCNLEVAVRRNARRKGWGVRQQVRATNLAVHEQFDGDAYLTHLSMRIDRRDGSAAVVNAGHSLALLLRGDVVEALPLDTDLPLGLFDEAEYHQQTLHFSPRDRILLLTDGIIDAAPDGGGEFGEERVAELLLATADQHPVEVVRALTTAVMAHRDGPLLDDATAVCVDYRRH
jgi:serine phosphatase RsbU (regulator of sigma subunit)